VINIRYSDEIYLIIIIMYYIISFYPFNVNLLKKIILNKHLFGFFFVGINDLVKYKMLRY